MAAIWCNPVYLHYHLGRLFGFVLRNFDGAITGLITALGMCKSACCRALMALMPLHRASAIIGVERARWGHRKALEGPVVERNPRVQGVLLRNSQKSRRSCRAALFGALLGLSLAGCAGDVPVPFVDVALPPAPPGPAPEYPSITPPAPGENQVPVMTDSERQAVEDQLKQLVAAREGSVKKKIEKSN